MSAFRHRQLLFFLAAGSIVGSATSQDLADVFARVSPSVVTVHTLGSRVVGSESPRLEMGGSVGSGVVLDMDGRVLTAAHVLEFADRIWVEFHDGTRVSANVVAMERGADLALLDLVDPPGEAIRPAALGDSSSMKVGNPVFVVGAPLRMERTLTAGHVSARRKEETFLAGMRHVEHFQTDAAINPGNSGGPLFNLRGEVIGVVCHITRSSYGSEGLGFAVTSNTVRGLLLDHPSVWLGFDSMLLPPLFSHALNVPGQQGGLLVLHVTNPSLASRLGLRHGTVAVRIGERDIPLGGDIILKVMGHALTSAKDVASAMSLLDQLSTGSSVRFSVLRAGRVIELSTTLEDR